MKRLKLMHLYQPRLRMVPAGDLRTPDQIARDIDKFAMDFFALSESLGDQLVVLIWGVERDLEMDELDFLDPYDMAFEEWPKHYYRKTVVAYSEEEDYVEDAGADYWDHEEGKEFVVPARTTLDRLRDEFPELELLSYDPTYNMIEHCASQT